MTEAIPGEPELHAYEDANACRISWLLVTLTTETAPRTTRSTLVSAWSAHYPQHAMLNGRRGINARITRALRHLAVAGIVRCEQEVIEVANRDRLVISAGNLSILEDAAGHNLVPADWQFIPTVPAHLRVAQATVIARSPQTGSMARLRR